MGEDNIKSIYEDIQVQNKQYFPFMRSSFNGTREHKENIVYETYLDVAVKNYIYGALKCLNGEHTLNKDNICGNSCIECADDIFAILSGTFGMSPFYQDALEQRNALYSLSAESSSACLSGVPGSGKSLILEYTAALSAASGIKCSMLAYTGRCAKLFEGRMNKYIPAEYMKLINCGTVHRALYSDNFESAVYFIDESSMLNSRLTAMLLSKIPKGSKVIFAGDEKQTGDDGNPFAELMASGKIPVYKLSKTYRHENISITKTAEIFRRGGQGWEDILKSVDGVSLITQNDNRTDGMK